MNLYSKEKIGNQRYRQAEDNVVNNGWHHIFNALRTNLDSK